MMEHKTGKQKQDVLLIIDPQNVYMPGQPWECKNMPMALSNILKLWKAQVVTQTVVTKYIASDCPVGTWRDYNEENKAINEDTWLNELVEDIADIVKEHHIPVFEKNTYSSYSNRALKEILNQADRVVITGVVAECCVLFTLLAGIDLGHKMIYIYDACAGIDEEHEALTRKLAQYYAPLHTQVMSSDEYLSEWEID